jgi:hypothetical protein
VQERREERAQGGPLNVFRPSGGCVFIYSREFYKVLRFYIYGNVDYFFALFPTTVVLTYLCYPPNLKKCPYSLCELE